MQSLAGLAFGTVPAGSSQTSPSLFEDHEAMHHGLPTAPGCSPARGRERGRGVNESLRLHTRSMEVALSMCGLQDDGALSLSVSQGGTQGELTALNTNLSIYRCHGNKVPTR